MAVFPTTTTAPASHSSRLPGIEGARACAALSVLVFHCWLYGDPRGMPAPFGLDVMPHFALGVILFFTLSGFLLYRPFVAATFDPAARPRLREFYRNRALRIVPAYWVILWFVALGLRMANLPNMSPGLQ